MAEGHHGGASVCANPFADPTTTGWASDSLFSVSGNSIGTSAQQSEIQDESDVSIAENDLTKTLSDIQGSQLVLCSHEIDDQGYNADEYDSSSHTESTEYCDCGQPAYDCGRCENGHCYEECRCATCHYCGELQDRCRCASCGFCDSKPFDCYCVPPSATCVQMKVGGPSLKCLSFTRPYRVGCMNPSETVVVRGHTFAVIVINHPWPYWKKDLRDVPGKVRAKTNELRAAIRKKVQQISDERGARRRWNAHIQKCIETVELEPKILSNYIYVTDQLSLKAMLDQLASIPRTEPFIGIDLEANNLGHTSPLCIIQIRDFLHAQTYIVDLLVLGKKAFSIKSSKVSLKSLLQDEAIKKLIFDTRQDSCALYGNVGIKLRGIIDLQVVHMLTYYYAPTHRTSLNNAVSQVCRLNDCERASWNANKIRIQDWSVFERRPLAPRIMAYAAGDVLVLKNMYENLWARLDDDRRKAALEWSAVEVERTWCKAKYWRSSRGRATPGFSQYFAVNEYEFDEYDE